MAEDLNVLLDQCEQRAQVLSQSADRAAEEVSQIVQFATNLAATLNAATQEAVANFEALSSQLETAEQNLESELQGAKEGLSNLQQKVSQLQSQSQEKLGKINNQLNELKSCKAEMLAEVEKESEQTKTSLRNLSQQVKEVEQEAINCLETAQNQIEEFRIKVNDGADSFKKRKISQLEQFQALQEDVRSQIESLASDFSMVAMEQNNKLGEVYGALATTTNEAITDIIKKFLKETLNDMTNNSAKTVESMSTLAETGAISIEIVDKKLAEIVNKIADVYECIKEIEPVLDEAKTILA